MPPLLHELPKLPTFDSYADPDLSPVNFDFYADPEPGPAIDFDTDPRIQLSKSMRIHADPDATVETTFVHP